MRAAGRVVSPTYRAWRSKPPKILFTEAEADNLGDKAFYERWRRWDTCSLCEQDYHGVVRCALGWACWKTYVGRPETDMPRINALRQLGNGLYGARHYEGALNAYEAELSMRRRLGGSERNMFVLQGNLANSYSVLGREEEALRVRRDVYSGSLRLNGEEHRATLRDAFNYANSLVRLRRYEEARSLLRRTLPVVRRVARESDEVSIRMRTLYAQALYKDASATLDDLREAVNALEEIDRTVRRVLGGAHPLTTALEGDLRDARAVLQAREDGKKVTFVRH